MTDDRPRIMDLAGGPVVADDWIRTGYGDAIPLVDAYLGIDTDGMKLTALNLYGIPAQHNNRGRNTNVEKADADLAVKGGGQVYVALVDLSYKVKDDFSTVLENWRGPAFRSASKRRDDLVNAVADEAHNARRIGQALWHFAETSEQDKRDIKAAVTGGAKLGLSVQGLATAASRVMKSLSALDLVFGVLDGAMKRQRELQRELDEIAKAEKQAAALLDTANPMRKAPPVNLDTHDWEVDPL